MGKVVDLLMPKIGLTMTEGTVARWLAAPGARFAAGDAIVVVETDKIANEVEAPAAGELVMLLSPEGTVVPVGTPIARWQLDDAPGRPPKPTAQPEPQAPDNAPRVHTPAVPLTDTGRIVATPYARRLAREASLDLCGIAGSGPRGRIKAADVLRALETQTAAQSIAPAAVAMQRAATPAAQRAALSFVTADVDATALHALDARLAGSRDRPFERRAYLALACLKALDSEGQALVRLGFEADGALCTLEGNARDTLSAVATRLALLQADGNGGDAAIFIAEGRARLLVPSVPYGWRMALGVGSMRSIRGDGVTTREMSLALVYDGAAVDHASAAHLLDRIAALLEEPLHLLAG